MNEQQLIQKMLDLFKQRRQEVEEGIDSLSDSPGDMAFGMYLDGKLEGLETVINDIERNIRINNARRSMAEKYDIIRNSIKSDDDTAT